MLDRKPVQLLWRGTDARSPVPILVTKMMMMTVWVFQTILGQYHRFETDRRSPDAKKEAHTHTHTEREREREREREKERERNRETIVNLRCTRMYNARSNEADCRPFIGRRKLRRHTPSAALTDRNIHEASGVYSRCVAAFGATAPPDAQCPFVQLCKS